MGSAPGGALKKKKSVLKDKTVERGFPSPCLSVRTLTMMVRDAGIYGFTMIQSKSKWYALMFARIVFSTCSRIVRSAGRPLSNGV